MTSPLYIMIGLHYWTTPGQYAADNPAHTNSPAVSEAKERMLEAGLLRLEGSDFKSTDALGVWVEALCAVPWPIQQWVMPKMSKSEARRIGGHARANALSPERRSEIATLAANARWRT